MKRTPSLSAMDQLANLRASLQHFEQSPDFGDSESVRAICRHLELRIKEAEGALRFPAWVQITRNSQAA
jgi:hypothetical protein